MMVPRVLVVLAALPVFAVPEDKDLVQYREYREKANIMGGVTTSIREFPFLAALEARLFNKVMVCAGTIITKEWVLTAAHCLEDEDDVPSYKPDVQVRAGSSYFYEGRVVRRATKVVSHHLQDDIALIKVNKPWPLDGATTSTARLPRQDESTPIGSRAWIVGWGDTDILTDHNKIGDEDGINYYDMICHGTTKEECARNLPACLQRLSQYDLHVNKRKCSFFQSRIEYLGHVIEHNKIMKSLDKLQGKPASELMKQEVEVISNVFCWLSYVWLFKFVTGKEICTSFIPGRTPAYTLQGDSGGPVVVYGKVVGIVSWGYVPLSLPDVHVRVSSYIDWIEENVGQLPSAKG